MIRRILLLAAAIAAAISTVTHWSVLLVAVALYAVTVIMGLRSHTVRRGGDSDQTGASIVLSVATGIVVFHAGAPTLVLVEVALLLAVLHALHLARHVLRVLVYRRWRTASDWRHLRVDAPTPRRVVPVAGPTLVPIPVWILAPVFAIYDVRPLVYVLLGILCLALVIVTFVPISIALLRNLRMPSEAARLNALTAALRAIEPAVLVHFNARATSAYAINEWMRVLTELNRTRRVVILTVDRQPWLFDAVEGDDIPLVHLIGAEAIEFVIERVPSLTLALYPRSTSPNKNLLRVPALYDVFIGHGESDKAETVNPATRAFDEVWIAGRAARERYLNAGIGIRADQLRITGRPQLDALIEAAAEAPPRTRKTVVYAPTWEGYFADDGYSSIEALGDRVADALLARTDVDVSYVPHPALGTLNRRFAEASTRIAARFVSSGHRVILAGSQSERFAALASADVLVTDIGGDLVDFLALDRPYVVMAPSDFADDQAFVASNPSASAGYVVSAARIDTLAAVVEASLAEASLAEASLAEAGSGGDSPHGGRRALAERYLGDLTQPQLQRFLDAVASTLEHIAATRPVRTMPPDPESAEALTQVIP